MRLALWRYELRRLGWPAILAPPLAVGAIGFLAILAQSVGNGGQVNRVLDGMLDALPLVAGIAAASATAGDPALELHLASPTSYRSTVGRRVPLGLGWSAMFAVLGTAGLTGTGRIVWPSAVFRDQLIWFAPFLWLAAAGAALSLGARGVAAGSGIVGAIWVFEEVFHDIFDQTPLIRPIGLFFRFDPNQATDWYLNRVVLLATAAGIAVLASWLLGRSERLLRGGSS